VIRDILQNFSFGQRLVLYRLLIALFLAGMIYYAFFFPKEGDRAMRRAAKAMSQAKGWKWESIRDIPQVQGKLQTLEEVACPSNIRSTMHQSQRVEGTMREWTNVSLTIGAGNYSYNSVADKWTLGGSTAGRPKFMCEALAREEDVPSLPPLSNWARHAFATKGELRDVGTGSCRMWDITIPRHNANPEKASVCIGENDDLPRIVTQYEQEIRYFDWNVPIDMQAPNLTPKVQP
jgi:hypothetical protein